MRSLKYENVTATRGISIFSSSMLERERERERGGGREEARSGITNTANANFST